jgi:hypothetical protein
MGRDLSAGLASEIDQLSTSLVTGLAVDRFRPYFFFVDGDVYRILMRGLEIKRK